MFILNHASSDDYQPFTLRETHLLLADSFRGAKFSINGGISLYKSGIVPVGKGFPLMKSSEDINPADVNLHLLPTNTSATDTFGVYTSSKPENAGKCCALKGILQKQLVPIRGKTPKLPYNFVPIL